MVRLSYKSVENGIILTLNGLTYVFQSPESMGDFLFEQGKNDRDHAPIKSNRVDLIICGYGEGKQIRTIKMVRELTGLGLKESKDLTDAVKVSGGATVLHGVTKSQALEAQAFFQRDTEANIQTRIQRTR